MKTVTANISTRITESAFDVLIAADALERAWSLRSTPAAEVVKAEDELIEKVRLWRRTAGGQA